MSKKPRVTVLCVANRYAAPNERIIEVGSGSKGVGCLISLREIADGTLIVEPYHADRVKVRLNRRDYRISR